MHTRLTRPRIPVEHVSPRLLRARIYLNNYFSMYTRLQHSRIRVEVASPAHLALGII